MFRMALSGLRFRQIRQVFYACFANISLAMVTTFKRSRSSQFLEMRTFECADLRGIDQPEECAAWTGSLSNVFVESG